MRRAIHDATACREALLRLPKLGLGELRQQWRVLYKAEASAYLSRELLLRAVAYRMQEVIPGGLRPQRQDLAAGGHAIANRCARRMAQPKPRRSAPVSGRAPRAAPPER